MDEQHKYFKEIAIQKNKIRKTTDSNVIIGRLKELIRLAEEAPPRKIEPMKMNFQESRRRSINMLLTDLKSIEDGIYFDNDLIQVQLGAEISKLLNTFVDGGVTEVNQLLEKSSQTGL